jgi:paraquat-inducible protein B
MHRRKRIDPRVIGSFVVGAILLSVGGLVFFGPGGLISETEIYVLHFDSSVKGLSVGSPVRFRGVKIGQVKDINVRVRPSDFEFHIPVIIEIEPSRIEADGTDLGLFDALKNSMQGGNPLTRLIEKGFRAQLQMDSLVTGRLYVNFDMHPDEPIYQVDYPSEYPALPTISSSLGELTKTFEDLPLRELADKLIQSANGFERLINSPSLHNGLAKFDETATQLNNLLLGLNNQIESLANEMKVTLQTTKRTLETTEATLQHVDKRIDPISSEFTAAMQAFTSASETTAATMQSIQQMTTNDSRLQQQLTLTLQELNRAARSIRYLSTELERDPQILLRGRNGGGSQ